MVSSTDSIRPSLSVLLPVHNGAATIQRAVGSVLDSDFPTLELVVIDDGSTDRTVGVLTRLAEPRLRVIARPHQGLVGALNTGLAFCRAPIIARMDADDVAALDRFSKQYQFLTDHPDVALVGGQVHVVDRSGRRVPSWRRYENWINSHLDPDSICAFRFVECPVAHPSVMARREVFGLGYREGPWPEDYDLWLRALAQGFRFAKINACVLDWTDRPSRQTRTDPRYSPEAFDRCRRMHLLAGPLQGMTTVDLWGAGRTGKPWLRWLLGKGFVVRHLVDVSQRKIGQKIHGVPVISPAGLGPADGTALLIAVGAAGAREWILDQITPLGHVPGRNAWFVA